MPFDAPERSRFTRAALGAMGAALLLLVGLDVLGRQPALADPVLGPGTFLTVGLLVLSSLVMLGLLLARSVDERLARHLRVATALAATALVLAPLADGPLLRDGLLAASLAIALWPTRARWPALMAAGALGAFLLGAVALRLLYDAHAGTPTLHRVEALRGPLLALQSVGIAAAGIALLMARPRAPGGNRRPPTES